MLTAIFFYILTILLGIFLLDKKENAATVSVYSLCCLWLLLVVALFYLGYLDIIAAIMCVTVLGSVTYFEPKNKWLIPTLITVVSLCLAFQLVPGIKRIALSAATINTGKALAAILLIMYLIKTTKVNTHIENKTFLALIIISVCCLSAAVTHHITSNVVSLSLSNKIIELLLINLFVTCIAEELFFRGFLLNALLRKNSLSYALIINSTMFAIVHVPRGIYFAAMSFIASMLYGAIYLKTGRISFAVAAHFLVNIPLIITM